MSSRVPRFRFYLTDGASIVGPVQGAGGMIRGERALERLHTLWHRGRTEAGSVAPGFFEVFPDYRASSDGPAYRIEFNEIETITLLRHDQRGTDP